MNAVPQLLRRALRQPARFARRVILPKVVRPASGALPAGVRDVRVVGLLSSASGVGKSARLCAEALGASGYDIALDDVSGLFASDDAVAYRHLEAGPYRDGGISIYHLNPPMLLPGLLKSGLSRYYGSYNIGYWAWELESLPREWVAALRFVDAVAVPSTFCRDAVRRYTDKPVVVVPHPVPQAARPAASRAPRREGPFRVSNIFNFGSSFERKNPVALVQAFRLAFGDDPAVELVLKTSQGHRHPRDKALLMAAVGDSPTIRIVDEVWPEERLADLLADSDVYASLHRSEGFGLTLAEAIMQETPVLATDWSGNTDFCPRDLAYPVDYRLVPFADVHGDYSQVDEARWAEPSVESAAEQLRAIRSRPEEARARASRLRGWLVEHLGRHTYAAALAGLAPARLAS